MLFFIESRFPLMDERLFSLAREVFFRQADFLLIIK